MKPQIPKLEKIISHSFAVPSSTRVATLNSQSIAVLRSRPLTLAQLDPNAKLIGGTPGLLGIFGKVIGIFSPRDNSAGVFVGMIKLPSGVRGGARFLGIPFDRIAMMAPSAGAAGIPGNFLINLITFLMTFTLFLTLWYGLGDPFQESVVPVLDLDPPLPPDWLSLEGECKRTDLVKKTYLELEKEREKSQGKDVLIFILLIAVSVLLLRQG